MWIVGHAQVAWFAARAAKLQGRDRRLVTWCGVLPDLDGLTLLGGHDAYLAGHHVYAHNVLALALLPAAACALARRRLRTFLLGVAAVALHLASDGLGFLELRPLWPFARTIWWPNQYDYGIAAFGEVLVPLALLAWGAHVFRRERVSVLEILGPRPDRWLAEKLTQHAGQLDERDVLRAPRGLRGWAREVLGDAVLLATLTATSHAVFAVFGRVRWPAVLAAGLAALVVVRWVLPWLLLRWLRTYSLAFPGPAATGDGP